MAKLSSTDIYGDLYVDGIISGVLSGSVSNNLIVKLNGGTTEGTNQFTFNGSAAKTVNITPSDIGAKIRIKKVIDLTNTTTYPEDKWFPCTADIPKNGLQSIEVANQLDGSSKPSWSAHDSGFTCNLYILALANGWGVTKGESLCLNHNYKWCIDDPCGYSQMSNSSNAVLWLRGGGKYNVYTSWDATWTPRTASTTITEQTVAPVTSNPGISLDTKATMMADINGNASSVGGYSFWSGTQAQYNALSSKSSTTVYLITG